MVFIWFSGRGRQEGVLKHMKNNRVLVFLVVWVIFPKFLGG